MRSKLKVKIKAQLTVNGLAPPSEYGLFTVKGLEWLRSVQLDAVGFEPWRLEIGSPGKSQDWTTVKYVRVHLLVISECKGEGTGAHQI
jgi:hypothetical protein